ATTGELLSAESFVDGVNWASHVDMETGRPVLNPEANYSLTGEGAVVSPAFSGAHLWQPLSFSPETGLVYIPAIEWGYAFVAAEVDDNPMGQKLGISFAGNAEVTAQLENPPVRKGFLLAWDPLKQEEAWR